MILLALLLAATPAETAPGGAQIIRECRQAMDARVIAGMPQMDAQRLYIECLRRG